jgi:hypothetical protein
MPMSTWRDRYLTSRRFERPALAIEHPRADPAKAAHSFGALAQATI